MADAIKILGPGCAKCTKLLELTNQAVRELQLDCTVRKETDIQQLLHYGVMIPPALVIDDQVVVSGKVPSLEAIKALLK